MNNARAGSYSVMNSGDGDEELERIQHQSTNGNGAQGQTELVPYAHRDLKPGYVGMNSVLL